MPAGARANLAVVQCRRCGRIQERYESRQPHQKCAPYHCNPCCSTSSKLEYTKHSIQANSSWHWKECGHSNSCICSPPWGTPMNQQKPRNLYELTMYYHCKPCSTWIKVQTLTRLCIKRCGYLVSFKLIYMLPTLRSLKEWIMYMSHRSVFVKDLLPFVAH